MSDPVNFIAEWLKSLMANIGLPTGVVVVIITLIGIVVMATFLLVMDIGLVWFERKMVARFQDRLGHTSCSHPSYIAKNGEPGR